MKKKKWDKQSEKLLDEIMEGKEEISLLDKELTPEEIASDVFNRFCALEEPMIETEKSEPRDVLLIILKDSKRRYKVKQIDITGMTSDGVKNLLKDADMFGYITSLFVKKLDKDNRFICNSLMRTLYTTKTLLKSVIDFDEESSLTPIILKGREHVFDGYDLWCQTENPRKDK